MLLVGVFMTTLAPIGCCFGSSVLNALVGPP